MLSLKRKSAKIFSPGLTVLGIQGTLSQVGSNEWFSFNHRSRQHGGANFLPNLKFDFLFLFYFLNSQFRSKLVKTISTSVTNLFSPFSFNFQPSLVSSNLFFMISPKIFILHYVPDLLIFISQSKTFTIFFQTFSHYFYFIFKPFCRIFPTFYFLFTILYFSFKFDQPFLCFFPTFNNYFPPFS